MSKMEKTPGQRMYVAVTEGDVNEVRRILAEHPEELTDYPGVASSWLHYAAREGKPTVIDAFLAAGLDVNWGRRNEGDTPLVDAVSKGELETARYLLSLGANPNLGRGLIGAINAKSHSLELVKLLVEHGADVNRWWRFGDEERGPIFNALSWATDNEREDIAQYLRSKGAVMPPEEPAPSPYTLAEEVVAYFREHVGPVKPQALVEIVPSSDVPVAIHVVPATESRRYLTLFTTGMSESPMIAAAEAEEYSYAELVIHLPADWPLSRRALRKEENRWPVNWLRTIASCLHDEDNSATGPVVIIPNGEPPEPLAAGCPFAGILMVADYENVGPIQTNDGRTIHLYTLIPVYSEECHLEVVELFPKFDAFGISKVVDVHRPNVAR